jgi:type IV secretion system protein VirD4
MNYRQDFIRRIEVKSGLAGGGTLTGSVLLDSWDAVAAGSVIDQGLTVTGTAGAAALAAAIASNRYRHSRMGIRRRTFRGVGWATRHQYIDLIGIGRLRRIAPQIRPSLVSRPIRRGTRFNPTDFGQYLGRSVTGTRADRGHRVYADYEKSVAAVGPPGSGKTAWLLHPVMDAPGALVTASTKLDVYHATSRLRSTGGRPVLLFNPAGYGGEASTLQWDPLTGCEHYAIAVARAKALVGAAKTTPGQEDAMWGAKAAEVIAAYLMAARLAGRGIDAVAYWLSHPDDTYPAWVLTQYPSYVPAGVSDRLVAEQQNRADKMAGSIWSVAKSALAFVDNPAVSASIQPGGNFDVASFVRARGTLYLVGDDADDTLAPLLAALTQYVYDGAVQLASNQPTGRLDPPFGVILDEVAKITPVPIDKWGADARGRGIYLTVAFQSLDQIRERWGIQGAGTIMNVFATKLIFGGLQNVDDLDDLERLIGPRKVRQVSEGKSKSDKGGSTSTNRSYGEEPIMPASQIRELPERHMLVLSANAKAAVVRYTLGQIRAEKELARLEKAEDKAERQRVAEPDASGVSIA